MCNIFSKKESEKGTFYCKITRILLILVNKCTKNNFNTIFLYIYPLFYTFVAVNTIFKLISHLNYNNYEKV